MLPRRGGDRWVAIWRVTYIELLPCAYLIKSTVARNLACRVLPRDTVSGAKPAFGGCRSEYIVSPMV